MKSVVVPSFALHVTRYLALPHFSPLRCTSTQASTRGGEGDEERACPRPSRLPEGPPLEHFLQSARSERDGKEGGCGSGGGGGTTTSRGDDRVNIVGMPKHDLRSLLEAYGFAKYRASQIWHAMYSRGASSIDEVTAIGKRDRALLSDVMKIDFGEVKSDQESGDGTRKWLIGLDGTAGLPFSDLTLPSTPSLSPLVEVDGYEGRDYTINHEGESATATAGTDGADERTKRRRRVLLPATVESVYIPELERGTVCVSSQVGCSLSCSFCHTGTQKLERNLLPGEIVSQLQVCRSGVGEFPLGQSRMVSNIVFMGQGEPLYNYANVKKAIDILADEEGCSISRRRITVSTSGVIPKIEAVLKELKVCLAISLHSANRQTRNELVPLNKTYPFEEMLSLCRKLSNDSSLNLRRKRILFEYVMIRGVNDSLADAKDLVRSLRGIAGLVNLIPFNPWPGTPYECSSDEAILSFAKELRTRGVHATVRWPRGRDILAACGQLRSTHQLKEAAKKRLLGHDAYLSSPEMA